MVGQQVQLQTVPSAAPGSVLSPMVYSFEQPNITDVVGNAFTGNTYPVPSPSPVPSAGFNNIVTFYWVSGGTKELMSVGTVSTDGFSYIGPVTDFNIVDYPVETPAPTISSDTTIVQVSQDTVPQWVNCAGGIVTITALHLGIACATASPTNPPGIMMHYGVSVPQSGGLIGVGQLVKESLSGTENGSRVQPWSSGSTPVLDTQFPMYNFTWPAGNGSALIPDSPFFNVGISPCTSVTDSYSFTDYFMYLPSARSGQASIWVTDATQTWSYSGTANEKGGAWGLAKGSISPGTVLASPSTVFPTWISVIGLPSFACLP